MYRKRRIALTLGVGAAVALMGTLYVTLGLLDAVGVVAVAAVLVGLYQVRRSARRALLYDGRSMPQPDDATARVST
jgi:Flp pilus assembly protein TadB